MHAQVFKWCFVKCIKIHVKWDGKEIISDDCIPNSTEFSGFVSGDSVTVWLG